ncbi:glutamate racemase [Candidatus Uhrbacteria bacterium]|nr:glutamate racemase [Candidatus Uhrbacteria bacterium]
MIGIFDSGFGGLTIFKHIARALPAYDFVYLGDNARAPYGNRSQETIYAFTVEAVDWLFKQGCTLVVLACNTASAEALRKLQQEWLPHYKDPCRPYRAIPLLAGEGGGEVLQHRHVLGVIRPVVEEAVKMTKGRVGVVGTRATITAGAYTRELQKLKPGVIVIEHACPLLVPLIEEGWAGKPETKRILRYYIRPLQQKVDTLILGCTHYPVLLDEFVRKMGKQCRVLDPGPIVAASLKDYLARHPDIDSGLSKKSVVRFCTTDDPARFNQWGGTFFGKSVKAERVVLSV